MNQALLKLWVFLRCLKDGEEGQDLVEYALLVSLIALALVSSMQQLASALVVFFTNVSTTLA
jgi:pilus assembly protein Flp/PilA